MKPLSTPRACHGGALISHRETNPDLDFAEKEFTSGLARCRFLRKGGIVS